MAARRHFICLALALVLGGLSAAAEPASLTTIAWERTDESLALIWNGQRLWRFNHGPRAAKPYFDPLAAPGGPPLTWNAPPDHPWHHGLWFSWKFINGVIYWEENPGTGRSDGTTHWSPPAVSTSPEGSAVIRLQLEYRGPEGQTVLTESRRIAISPPDTRKGYALDWTSKFEALVPVLLDRTPITGEPNGQSWGGYAGLSLRMVELGDPLILSDEGEFSFQEGLANLDARAVDYGGIVEGSRWGVAMFQHPDNPIDPTPWYVINRPEVPFHYFSPAVLYRAPRRLAKGETLSLRYAIRVHPGKLTDLKDELAHITWHENDTAKETTP